MAKRGKMLGGKPPKRGGRLSRPAAEGAAAPSGSTQTLLVLTVGFLVLGTVAGFGWQLDRQLQGGLFRQRAEAVQRPDWVPIEALPPYLPRAFLSVIDPNFEGTGTFRSREEGNTLQRELVRQIHLLGDGLPGQARELVMAPLLEQRASKRELLELYLNRIYLGIANDLPVFGVHYAAQEYFGKAAVDLTLGEAATLAGLLLEPRLERPQDGPGAVGARRNEVLRGLLMDGQISAEEYAGALNERLGFQPGITEMPMTRRARSGRDTTVIRLPPEYRPQPIEEQESD